MAIETKFHLGEDSGQRFTQIRISQENHDETETNRLSRKVRCVISNEIVPSLAKDSVKSSFTQSVCLGKVTLDGLQPYPAWVPLPSFGYFTQLGQLYPGWATLPSLGNFTQPLLP